MAKKARTKSTPHTPRQFVTREVHVVPPNGNGHAPSSDRAATAEELTALRIEKVRLPSGRIVYLREPDAEVFNRVQEATMDGHSYEEVNRNALAMCLLNEDGERIFSDPNRLKHLPGGDWAILAVKISKYLNAIFSPASLELEGGTEGEDLTAVTKMVQKAVAAARRKTRSKTISQDPVTLSQAADIVSSGDA